VRAVFQDLKPSKTPTKVPTVRIYLKLVIACKLLRNLEAAIGIEPMNKGFAEIQKHGAPKVMDG
jgi:hypothetical protein